MAKHRMFGAPNLACQKKIAQLLVVMVETFRMSEVDINYKWLIFAKPVTY